MKRSVIISVAVIAAATLLLESTFIRLLAVAQFYHFAFLVISLALLGFGASGTLLAISPGLQNLSLDRLLSFCGVGFSLSTALAYIFVNVLPFDSYSIAWDRRQILYFALYYLSLTLPFIFSGLAIAAALAQMKENSHIIYAANLSGSAIGVILAPVALYMAGILGVTILCITIGLLPLINQRRYKIHLVDRCVILGSLIALGLLSSSNLSGHAFLGMSVSPYKGLPNALRYPGSETLFSQWNAFSYVSVVANAGTRVLPGLSYMDPGMPPEQAGLSIDADSLQPVTLVQPEQFTNASYMPEVIAFDLHPHADTLVLEAGAGLGIEQAIAGGARSVTATVDNPLIPFAIHRIYPNTDIFDDPRVSTVTETSRVFLRREHKKYEVIYLPLTDAYRPITNGVFSLVENYTLTVDAFAEMIAHLSPGGVFVATRWLQTSPSESIRIIAMLEAAFNRVSKNISINGTQFKNTFVAYRGIQTFTVLLQPGGWNETQLSRVRSFTETLRYDLVYAPDIKIEETNRFNILPEPVDTQVILKFLSSTPSGFYQAYPYAISPPTDDHPFFYHFFRWGQLREVLANLGHKWQPFGGSGYLVLLALLILVTILSAILIILPILKMRTLPTILDMSNVHIFFYFTLLGIAYLFVEIPLIQRSILLLGHPTYAFTIVVLSLLFFSSMGSLLARKPWLPQWVIMFILVILAIITPLTFKWICNTALGWSFPARIIATMLGLAPLGFFMGFPFPMGLTWFERKNPLFTQWVWAVNGSASVIASVLAAILSLSYGYTFVLYLGAAAYGIAAVLLTMKLYRLRG